MAEFTQAKLDELREKAMNFFQDDRQLPLNALFVEYQKNNAVFGVWLTQKPNHKVGLPLFVIVTPHGACTQITDIEERIRLLAILEKLPNFF